MRKYTPNAAPTCIDQGCPRVEESAKENGGNTGSCKEAIGLLETAELASVVEFEEGTVSGISSPIQCILVFIPVASSVSNV